MKNQTDIVLQLSILASNGNSVFSENDIDLIKEAISQINELRNDLDAWRTVAAKLTYIVQKDLNK